MTALKAIRCWLRLKVSEKAPKNWSEKRIRIDDRITALVRNSVSSASIEELPVESDTKANDNHDYPNVSKKDRLEIGQRCLDMKGVIEYNILTKKEDRKINDWRSYPGLDNIIDTAREIIETGKKEQIEKLAELMQGHESQQSATIVATIPIFVGNKMDTERISVSEECLRAFCDMSCYGIHQL